MTPGERIAKAFHERYELHAPSFGYETRKDSAVPWEQVPATNRQLMIQVASDLLATDVIRSGQARAVLERPMNPDLNEAGASSIREYLVCLLQELWAEKDGFSGKRPFGNSGWEHELYDALGVDGAEGDRLIDEAITELAQPPE